MSFQPNSNIMNNYMNLFIQYCLMKNRKTYLENLGYNTTMINNMYNMMNNNMINNTSTTLMNNNMNNPNTNFMMNNMNMNTCMMNNMNNMNNMNMNTCMMNNMNNMNMNTGMMNNMNNMNMNTCMMNNMNNNNCMNNMNMNTCMMNNMNYNNFMNNMNMNTCMMNNNMNSTCLMNNMNNMNMNTCMMNNMNNNCMNNTNNNRRFSMFNCMNNNNFLNMMNNNYMNNLGNTWSCSDFKNNFNFNNNIDDLSNSFNNLNLNNTVNLSHGWNNPLSFSFNNVNNPLMNTQNMNINSITNNKTKDKNDEEETNGNESQSIDSEVTLKFTFMGSQTHLVKCKLNEKFCDILERFKNEQCPEHFKNNLSVALHNGSKIDPEKALYESGIKNNDIILFIVDSEDLNDEGKKDKENEEGEYQLTDEEIAIIRKWREEFDAMNFIKNIFKKNNDSMDDFLEFVRNKELQQLQVKEHKHKLVYLLSNYEWKCNKCKKKYEKKDAKYYCSICNFNLCEECHSKQNYNKKKVFPEGVKPSNKSVNIKFLDTDYHEHRLIYCRSSRSAIGYNGWNCDNCRDSFQNETWSFYCTNCDFDLCTKCAGFN